MKISYTPRQQDRFSRTPMEKPLECTRQWRRHFRPTQVVHTITVNISPPLRTRSVLKTFVSALQLPWELRRAIANVSGTNAQCGENAGAGSGSEPHPLATQSDGSHARSRSEQKGHGSRRHSTRGGGLGVEWWQVVVSGGRHRRGGLW